MLALLRQRNFALLWIGQIVSMTGDWVLIVALPFYIYQRTGSALATGAMFVVETLPRLFLGSLAGVFVDRWNRRRTMIAADLFRALILLPLLLIHSRDTIWLAYVVALAENIISQFFSPAYAALIPILVAEQHLSAANSLSSLGEEMTRLMGPAFGGALFGLLGLNSVTFFDSFSYVFSGVTLFFIVLPLGKAAFSTKSSQNVESPALRLWQEWLDGLKLMRRERIISALFIVAGIWMVGEGIGRAAIVPFLSGVAHGNAFVFSWILTAQGIGGIFGALLYPRLNKFISAARLIAYSSLAIGMIGFIEVTFPLLAVVFPLVALVGMPVVFFSIGIYTTLQQSVTDQYRGRVFGAYYNNNTLLLLVGMACSSILASIIGIRSTLYLWGLFYFLSGVVALILLRPDFIREKDVSDL